jgi:3-oxoadipate CoA-transferase alpha subunit
VPQGNLTERIRAACAGIGAFFTHTGFGTDLAFHADGSEKETRFIDGKHYILEYPLHADLSLIKAESGDRWGNLTFRKAARNFGPIMAMAGKRSVASVHDIVELGAIDPEHIVTPGIFVSALVQVPRLSTQGGGFKLAP